MKLLLELAGRAWRTHGPVHDLSIPLEFGGRQPNHFGAADATATPLMVNGFIGDTGQGGSCNCVTLTLTPHCNGTHTETLAHLTGHPPAASAAVRELAIPAMLVTVTPTERDGAAWIDSIPEPDTRGARALIVRTLPNDETKRTARWDQDRPTPCFSAAAMRRIVAAGFEHLLFDGPSIDPTHDDGRLTCHRIFWGMPDEGRDARLATRSQATVTEMVFVPDAVKDGLYLLSLQLAPFVTDATPSRPLIQALVPA